MRKFTSEKTYLETLAILANAANIPASSQNRQTSEFVRQVTRRARRDLKQVQKDADIPREQYSAETAKFSASLHHMDTNAASAAIAAREGASKHFSQLRSVMKPGRSNGLDRIDVPNDYAVSYENEEVPRIPLVTNQELEDALLPPQRNFFGSIKRPPSVQANAGRSSGWPVLPRIRKHF
jgi:hypothetical protein